MTHRLRTWLRNSCRRRRRRWPRRAARCRNTWWRLAARRRNMMIIIWWRLLDLQRRNARSSVYGNTRWWLLVRRRGCFKGRGMLRVRRRLARRRRLCLCLGCTFDRNDPSSFVRVLRLAGSLWWLGCRLSRPRLWCTLHRLSVRRRNVVGKAHVRLRLRARKTSVHTLGPHGRSEIILLLHVVLLHTLHLLALPLCKLVHKHYVISKYSKPRDHQLKSQDCCVFLLGAICNMLDLLCACDTEIAEVTDLHFTTKPISLAKNFAGTITYPAIFR